LREVDRNRPIPSVEHNQSSSGATHFRLARNSDNIQSDIQNVWNARGKSADMTAWARRTETLTAKSRRHLANREELKRESRELKREKTNGVEEFLVSPDMSTMIVSYYGHHLCVFNLALQKHVATMDSSSSMLQLYVAAITTDGKYLAHVNITNILLFRC